MTINGYLAISEDGKARFTNKKPFLKVGEIVVRIELDVNDAFFEKYPKTRELLVIEKNEK